MRSSVNRTRRWPTCSTPGMAVAAEAELVVDADQRGCGIGRHLLEAVEAAARRRGCGAVELTSSTHRHGAQRFYLAAGCQDLPHRCLKQLDPAGDGHHGEETPSTGGAGHRARQAMRLNHSSLARHPRLVR